MRKTLSAITALAIAGLLMCGCTSGNASESSKSTASEQFSESLASEDQSEPETTQDLLDRIVTAGSKAGATIEEFIREREDSSPQIVRIGEWANATENLDVKVDSVEKGPYDYADSTPTVKVTVSMRNLTDHTLTVKASNWNADNTDGQRVDHKLCVKDSGGNTADRSFELTRISPGSVFTGVVYFDGDGLVDVVYEPHWLVSSQNQYIYFDVS